MQSTLMYLALCCLIGSVITVLATASGFAPLFGSSVFTYEQAIAYGVISIAASSLCRLINEMVREEK